MRFLLLVLTFVCATSVAAEKPVILSGFDDVLRQAENTGLIKAALKILEEDKTFSGMAELYTVLSQERPDPKFYLVSAISSMFDGRIDRFLQASHFPSNRRYLRNWTTEWSIGNFKVEKIKQILAQNPNQKFIVVFDNSEASLSLAKTIQKDFKNEVLAVYLRQVVQKELPQGAIGFYTAFDIAVQEYTAGRISLSELETVAAAVLKEQEVELLFPNYAVCPKNYSPCEDGQKNSSAICKKVQDHVQGLCR